MGIAAYERTRLFANPNTSVCQLRAVWLIWHHLAAAAAAVQRVLAVRWADAFYSVSKNNLLSNFLTFSLKTVGNFLFKFYRTIIRSYLR